jgi:hypothetical protein
LEGFVLSTHNDGDLALMNEIISRVFVFLLLLVYVGLVMGFLLWNLRRWLGSSGKKRVWPAILEHLSVLWVFNPHYDSH